MSIEDLAQEREAQVWAANNIDRRRMPEAVGPDHPKYGPAHCMECEDDMPAVRRSYQFTFCKPCAERRERRRN